jgi:hypothetical protein
VVPRQGRVKAMPWFGRKRKKPRTPAERLASSRNWRQAAAQGKWHQRGFRSLCEGRLLRSLVWQHPEMGMRALARRLGCDRSWIVQLRRSFKANPERQRKREELFGPATFVEFDEERAKRLNDLRRFALYRQPRIRRKPKSDPERIATEKQVRAFLRSQRAYERKHGSLEGWTPHF